MAQAIFPWTFYVYLNTVTLHLFSAHAKEFRKVLPQRNRLLTRTDVEKAGLLENSGGIGYRHVSVYNGFALVHGCC